MKLILTIFLVSIGVIRTVADNEPFLSNNEFLLFSIENVEGKPSYSINGQSFSAEKLPEIAKTVINAEKEVQIAISFKNILDMSELENLCYVLKDSGYERDLKVSVEHQGKHWTVFPCSEMNAAEFAKSIGVSENTNGTQSEELSTALDETERIYKILNVDPNAALISAWIEFEGQLTQKFYDDFENDDPEVASLPKMMKYFSSKGILSEQEINFINDAHQARDDALHYPHTNIPYDVVNNAISSLLTLSKKISNYTENS